jgi:hypothetical protein
MGETLNLQRAAGKCPSRQGRDVGSPGAAMFKQTTTCSRKIMSSFTVNPHTQSNMASVRELRGHSISSGVYRLLRASTGDVEMSSQIPRDKKNASASLQRVTVPTTQTKTGHRPPPMVMGWLGLLPKSALPIKSHEDFAAKISALLLGRSPTTGTDESGHSLPAGRQPQQGERERAS